LHPPAAAQEPVGGPAQPGAALDRAVGAFLGVTVGFVVASATDWPLKEGGIWAPVILGGGAGLLAGSRIHASREAPELAPGPLRLTLEYGLTRATTATRMRAAIASAGFGPEDQHHNLVPSATLTHRFAGSVDAGVDVSGVAGQRMVGGNRELLVAEDVAGWAMGIVVGWNLAARDRRTFTAHIGAGVDRYSWSVLSYFTPRVPTSAPGTVWSEETRRVDYGLQLRGDVDVYAARDVALRLGVRGRWAPSARVPEVRFQASDPEAVRVLPAHDVGLGGVQLSMGLVTHF